MKSVNEVFLLGRVGNDPEIRATSGGTRIAKLSLATDRYAKQGQKAETDWHRLTCFGKLVDVVEQWVKKGDPIHVRGRIQYSTTEGENGPKYWTEIVVNDLVLLGGKSASTDETAAVTKRVAEVFDADPIPF